MKKTLTILLVAALAISTVIGGAAVAKNITTDKADQTPTQVATRVTATEKTTETQKTASTQTQNTKADTKEEDTNKAENTSNEQTSVQSDRSVMGLCYRNISNPDHCSLEVKNQYGNTIDFTISSSNENYSHIATADISVTFDNVDESGVPYGVSEFEYTDSFGNSGTGEIDFNSCRTILTINETDNAGSVWSIANASGKFL